MSPRTTLPLLLTVAVSLPLVLALNTAAAAGSSASTSAASAYRSLARTAPQALGGGGFVCRVATRSGGSTPRVTLFVADGTAKARARRLVRRLGATRVVTIRIGQQRRRVRDLNRIIAEIKTQLPAQVRRAGTVRLILGGGSSSRCPKVIVRVSPDEQNDRALDVVSGAPKRYGNDRVEVDAGSGTTS